ncbi:hypothetical protein R5R35_013573 [Gryllus longicercus]|uniref:Angiotensin-converting enzyme n=1 Tax=Gryllus longicercus TaxID=2509291 RepID=A0AAN9VQ41_9ORTH
MGEEKEGAAAAALAARADALGAARARWAASWCGVGPVPACAPRALQLLCRGPRYSPDEAREVGAVLGALARGYWSARVLDGAGRAWRGEPDLERLMRASRDPRVLRWAWLRWRDAAGPPARPLYRRLVPLLNSGARRAGYADAGALWRAELETPGLRAQARRLLARVQPLFALLHAVVRARLPQRYPGCCPPHAPLPAHLLGDLWAQDWSSLWRLLAPAAPDLTAALRGAGLSVRGMAERAEDVFRSLGLPRLPPAFWRRSQLRADAPAGCHGTAANMFRPGDYRIRFCAEVDENDFYVIHHELGHIQYYMAYRNQPVIFQDGANSAFQEAVGDAVTLGVWTPQHLLRLGLVNDSVSPEVLGAQLLVRQALRQLPQLTFALALEEWRWGVFAGEVPPDRYNGAWWALRRSLQGVCPPARRDEADFDPAAKFHVPDNTPYIRYFLSGLLQVQMFKALCEIAVLGGVGRGPLPFPLHQCDIYGSQRAGRKLREMMSLGASRHWTDALFTLTGTRELSAEPLLEYFAPLVPWLRAQLRLHNASLGWGDCPHDY